MNFRKNDRWLSYRFYRALQRPKSPMRYFCEIFGARRFSSFSTQSALFGRHPRTHQCLLLREKLMSASNEIVLRGRVNVQ